MCVLDGALAVAEVVIGLCHIGENPRILGSQGQGGFGVRQGFFAKLVFRIVGAEHGLD